MQSTRFRISRVSFNFGYSVRILALSLHTDKKLEEILPSIGCKFLTMGPESFFFIVVAKMVIWTTSYLMTSSVSKQGVRESIQCLDLHVY